MSPFEVMDLIREAVDAEREKSGRVMRILERLLDEERARNRQLNDVVIDAREKITSLGHEATARREAISLVRQRVAVLEPVLAELDRATTKFPTWPNDPLHALAILGEEFGELTKALLQLMYEPHNSHPSEARAEAIQTAAMALRLLISLDRYEYRRGEQHHQCEITAAKGRT